MKQTTFVLTNQGSPCAVIIANEENTTEFETKVSQAIKEEVVADEDTQFELQIGTIGDWGEDIEIKTTYVNNGELITDDEFQLRKLVSY